MITLIVGGASSGKSAVAEDICMALPGKKAYVATMTPFGEQAEKRVLRHLKLREGKGMATIERYTDIAGVAGIASLYDVLLIECMTNLVANEQFRSDRELACDIAAKIYAEILKLTAVCESVIIVTCDLFCDGITYTPETGEYMRQLGRLNQMLAAKADRVVEVFYGIRSELKGGYDETA